MAVSSFTYIRETKDAVRLLGLVDKACNMTSKIEHFATQLCESTCILQELRGSKLTLSKYYDHFKQRIKSTELTGFAMDAAKCRVAILKREEDETGSTTNPAYVDCNTNITKHCNQQYYAMLYQRHAGDKCDQFCRNLENAAYIMGTDNIPHTVDEMHTLLQNYTAPANVKIESSGNHPMSSNVNAANGNNHTSNSGKSNAWNGKNSHAKHLGHSFQQQDLP